MNRPTYVLPLTGKEFESKLSLIDGDSKQVIINAEKISALSATESSDDELTLVTKGYVDDKIGAGNTGVPENLPQSDWNQNDENAADYVKNRTHYVEFHQVTELFNNYEVHHYSSRDTADFIYYEGEAYQPITTLKSGDILQIKFDDVVLTGKVDVYKDDDYRTDYNVNIESSSTGLVSGYNFFMSDLTSHVCIGLEISVDYYSEIPDSIQIEISRIVNNEIITTLDEKYIPDTIARTLELDALEETLTQRINESGIDAPISSGTGKNSLIIGEGVASGDAAIAGGSTDKQMLESIVGGTVAALITAKAAEASGDMSLALGANNKSITAGAGTIGFGNQGGVKGYYWDTIDFSTNTIKLSHNRRTSSYGSMNYVTDFDWTAGDIISMVNDNNYFARSIITSVDKANSTITVDSLPFTEIKYSTGLLDSLTLKPHDRTIFAVYQNDSNTIKTGKPRWVSRSGSVELGFGNFTLGVMNLNTGNASFTSGYNNWAGGAFGASIGRDNRSGYAAFAGGVETKADAYACIAHGLGLLNTSSSAAVFGQYNSIEDIENQLLVIGCGSSSSDRKNALTVSRTGDVKAKGSIYSNNEKVLTAKDLVNKADNERFDSLENPASYLFEQDFSVVPDNWDNGKEAPNNYITNSTFRDFTGICGSSVNGVLRGGSGIKTIEFTTFLDETCFHIYATSKCRYKFFNTLTNKERLSQADLGRKVRITAKYFTAQGNSSIGLMSAKSDLYGQKYYKSFASQNAGDAENWADLDVIVIIDQTIIDEGAALLTFDIGANSELYFTDIRCVELSSIEEIVEDIADITPDWNQNDENAADYVKNRTHYEESPVTREYVILDKSYSFEEAQLEGYGGIGDFKYPLVKDWSEIITVGSKLTVTIDGETYEAIFEAYHYGFELPGLLAGTGYDDPDNYPTLYFDADGITLHFGYNAGGISMDIGPLTISTNEVIVHQLDEKFIPDTIARSAKLEKTEENLHNSISTLSEQVNLSEDTINNLINSLSKHKYDSTWYTAIAATPASRGKEYAVCSLCGHKIYRKTPKLEELPGLYNSTGFTSWNDLVSSGTITLVDNTIMNSDKNMAGKLIIPEGIFLGYGYVENDDGYWISDMGLSDCTLLESVVIPEGQEWIPGHAFLGCTSLNTLYLPSTILKNGFDDASFADCYLLENVYFNGTMSQWQEASYRMHGMCGLPDSVNVTIHCTDGDFIEYGAEYSEEVM